MKNKIIIIAGPTACGKTAVSVELAKMLDTCVVSADSMQVYRYMDIGTAKITQEEMQGIKHYLINCIDPTENYSVSEFQKMANSAVTEIISQNNIPIVAGGTGFYINALIYNNDFNSVVYSEKTKKELYDLLDKNGSEYMFNMLLSLDREYASVIHKNNIKKVMHALEYIKNTGNKFSSYNEEEKNRKPYYDARLYILNRERSLLYSLIDKRVDKMMQDGLVDEVKHLTDSFTLSDTAKQGLGYKEIIDCLNGDISLAEATELIKLRTRHFAKRQLTWFKNKAEGKWIDMTELSAEQTAKIIYEDVTGWINV